MTSTPIKIGATIRRARIAAGMKSIELADDVGLKNGHLSMIERDVIASPGVRIIYDISKALGITIDHILGCESMESATDTAFHGRYLRQPEPLRARIRAVADALMKENI